MTDETQMLDEGETLALLRAGQSGTEPALTDITPLALRGGLRMRRRRQLGQVGAGLVATAAAAAALFIATPGLNPDGRRDVAIADGTGDPAAMTEAEVHINNLRVLTDALGSDFRIVRPDDGRAYVALTPGSTAAQGLPAGYLAEADVVVSSSDVPCEPDPDREGTTTECRAITAPDGREVDLESRGGSLKPDTPVETRTVRFTQPDGDAIRVILRVEPESVSDTNARVPRDAILSWVDPYVERLAKVAVDGRTALGSVAEREGAAAATDPEMGRGSVAKQTQGQQGEAAQPNNVYLREILGSDWSLVDEHDGPGLFVGPGSALELSADRVSGGLPGGSTASANVTVYTHNGPLTQLCPVGTGVKCSTRELPGGGRVLVAKLTYGTGTSTDNLIVSFLRPNKEVVVVGLSAVAPELPDAEREEARRQISTWIESYTDTLIAAATDSRMHR